MLCGIIDRGNHVRRMALMGSFAWLLAGCSTVITSERVTRSGPTPGSFANAAVPTEVHGDIPGVSNDKLAAQYAGPNRAIASLSTNGLISSDVRVKFYLNRSNLPAVASLCDAGIPITYDQQVGPVTNVVAVLCNGNSVVSRAEGTAKLAGLSQEELKERLDRFRSDLFTVTNANGRYGGDNHS